MERKPEWLKVRLNTSERFSGLKKLVREKKLNTVCVEAACPNIYECWNAGTATFMILGDTCTRSCGFCNVKTGRSDWVDPEEPLRVAESVRTLGLKHAVITSVNRDELLNGGAEIFAQTIREIRRLNPECAVELLVPDFKGSAEALEIVMREKPDILAHNTETVPRLYATARPQANYHQTLDVIRRIRESGLISKSGVMLGLGETLDEVRDVMRDLQSHGCQILTLGQYLQPTRENLPVSRYVHPDEFAALREEGMAMGFDHVESGPLVRSSYHAERQATALPRH